MPHRQRVVAPYQRRGKPAEAVDRNRHLRGGRCTELTFLQPAVIEAESKPAETRDHSSDPRLLYMVRILGAQRFPERTREEEGGPGHRAMLGGPVLNI